MNITELHKKILDGTDLTDEDRAFLRDYDPNKDAASARRKAEKQLGEAQAEVERLNARVKELEDAAESKDGEKNVEIAKLSKQLSTLTDSFNAMKKEADEAKAETAKMQRSAAISEYAKTAGLSPAKGIKEALFMRLFAEAVGETDLADTGAMEKAVAAFKADNPGLVAAGGARVPSSGKPSESGSDGGKNPFAKATWNLTDQMFMRASDPAKAAALEAEAMAAESAKN